MRAITAENVPADQTRVLERLLVNLERHPWDALYRVAMGFGMLPLYDLLIGEGHSGWWLLAVFLGFLAALRTVPAVVRKLCAFSDAAQQEWHARRQTAKHYDSYQWQKLLWIGSGLGLFILLSSNVSAPRVVLAVWCIASGAAGFVAWCRRVRNE
jgi:hypothetical protein